MTEHVDELAGRFATRMREGVLAASVAIGLEGVCPELGTIGRVDLDRIRSRLRRNASLFDRPEVYVAGVEDTVAAIVALADGYDPDSTMRVLAAQKSRMI